MKWLSFFADNHEYFGFVVDDLYAVDYGLLSKAIHNSAQPRTLLELVEAGPSEWAKAASHLAVMKAGGQQIKRYALDSIVYRAPIRRPSKILGVPINNSSINKWGHRAWKAPGFFLKPPSALVEKTSVAPGMPATTKRFLPPLFLVACAQYPSKFTISLS